MFNALSDKLNSMRNVDYEAAKEGGRHKGFYQQWQMKRIAEIEKSIRSLHEQIAIHKEKISNPYLYIEEDISLQQLDGLVNRYWPKEILNFEQQINILEGILEERKDE